MSKETTERLETAIMKYPDNWAVVRDEETRELLKAWDKNTGQLWARVKDDDWMWMDCEMTENKWANIAKEGVFMTRPESIETELPCPRCLKEGKFVPLGEEKVEIIDGVRYLYQERPNGHRLWAA